GGAPDRGLLAHGSRLPPAPRGPHRPDAIGRSPPAGRGGAGGARWLTRRVRLSQMILAEGGGLMIPFGRRLRRVRPPALAFFVPAVGRSKKGPRLPGSARAGRRYTED